MADRSKYPSEQADKYLLRLPEGMRELLKVAAAENNRTMNSEIIARLRDTFDRDARDAAYLASYQPPSEAEVQEQAKAYQDWLDTNDQGSLPGLDPVEEAMFDELSQMVMRMAKKVAAARRPMPDMTPQDFYEYSMEQIRQMPEEDQSGAASQLNQTMEKAAKRFGFSWTAPQWDDHIEGD